MINDNGKISNNIAFCHIKNILASLIADSFVSFAVLWNAQYIFR